MTRLVLTRSSGSKSQPAVWEAVNQLRRECIASAAGVLLGQEEDLIKRFRISRPTLRQAAALLGQEQLLEVRRGPGGGYFTTRPNISGVVHMAAIWLESEHVTLPEIQLSTSTIRAELAPLAARNLDDAARTELGEFLARDRAIAEEDYTFQIWARAERTHNDIVGRASGNRVLHLYLQISLDLAGSLSPLEDVLFGKPERFLEWRRQRNRMLEAILARDPEIARLEAERCAAKLRGWLANDASQSVTAEAETI